MTDSRARLVELAKEVAADPGNPAYPELADILVEVGRYAEAAEVCKRGLAVAPSIGGARALAEARLRLGDPEGAREVMESALADIPDDPDALRVLGSALLELGRLEEARQVLERSASLDPSEIRTLDLLGRLPEPAGDLEEPSSGPDCDGGFDLGAQLREDEESFEGLPALEEPPGEARAAQWDLRGADVSVEPSPPSSRAESFSAPESGSSLEADEQRSGSLEEAGGREGTPKYELDFPSPEEEPSSDPPSPEEEEELELAVGPSQRASRSAESPKPEQSAPPEDVDPYAEDRHGSKTAAPVGQLSPPPSPTPKAPLPQARDARRPPASKRLISTLLAAPERFGDARKLFGSTKGKVVVASAGGLILLLVVSVLVTSMQADRDQAAFDSAVQAAGGAFATDTERGYREAAVHLDEALEIRPADPEALGLMALSAALLFTRFDVGIEMAALAEDYLAKAEAQLEMTAEAAAARALLHLADDRPADAVTSVANYLREHPEHPVLLWVRAKAVERLEREDMAMEFLERARRGDPAFLPASASLADMMASHGDASAAHELRLEILEEHPAHFTTLMGLLTDADEPFVDQEGLLETLLAASSEWAALSEDGRCSLHLGVAQLASSIGRPDVAARSENSAVAEATGQACRVELGRHLLSRSRADEAYDLLAAAAVDGEADARLDAARAALSAGRPARALDILEPEAGPAEKALNALSLHRLGRVESALQEIDEAASDSGAGAEVFAVQALLLIAEGDLRTARRVVARAERGVSKPSEALMAGLARLELGQARAAAAVLGRAVQRHGATDVALLSAAARAASASGRPRIALTNLERAVRYSPDTEQAVEMYLTLAPSTRALSFFSELPEPWSSALAGLAHLADGDSGRASELLESAASKGGGYWTDILDARINVAARQAGLEDLRGLRDDHGEKAISMLILADELLRLGHASDAADLLRESSKRHPWHGPTSARLIEANVILASATDSVVQEADAALRSLSTHPVDSETLGRARASLALACAKAGDRGCVRRASTQARREAPESGRTLLLVGRALDLAGNARAALAAYRRASGLPGGEEAFLWLGLSLEGEAGVEALERFLGASPGHAMAGRAREALAGAGSG